MFSKRFSCNNIYRWSSTRCTVRFQYMKKKDNSRTECMLSCITLCLRWEMNLQLSTNRSRYCIIVYHCNAWSNNLSDLTTNKYVNVYRYKYVYKLPLNIHSHKSPWLSRLGRHSSKPEVVGSNPAVDNNFSFCNSRSLRVADTSNQSIQMKSTVAYT